MLAILRERGLIGAGCHASSRSSRRCTCISSRRRRGCSASSLVDAVGERRVQNQPGTDTRVPELAGAAGGFRRRRAVLVEDLAANERFASLTSAVNAALDG